MMGATWPLVQTSSFRFGIGKSSGWCTVSIRNRHPRTGAGGHICCKWGSQGCDRSRGRQSQGERAQDYRPYRRCEGSSLVAAGTVSRLRWGRQIDPDLGSGCAGNGCSCSRPQRAYKVLAWSPDGTYLASGGHDFLVRVWKAAEGEYLGAFTERLKKPFVHEKGFEFAVG